MHTSINNVDTCKASLLPFIKSIPKLDDCTVSNSQVNTLQCEHCYWLWKDKKIQLWHSFSMKHSRSNKDSSILWNFRTQSIILVNHIKQFLFVTVIHQGVCILLINL